MLFQGSYLEALTFPVGSNKDYYFCSTVNAVHATDAWNNCVDVLPSSG